MPTVSVLGSMSRFSNIPSGSKPEYSVCARVRSSTDSGLLAIVEENGRKRSTKQVGIVGVQTLANLLTDKKGMLIRMIM